MKQPTPPKPTAPELKERLHAERLAMYRAHRSSVGEQLLRAALRTVAAIDAVATVNKMLEDDFGLVDVRLDQKEAEQSIATVLRAEVTSILAARSMLPAPAQAQLVERLVARMVPLRDNQNAVAKRAPDQLRADDLERLIERDMKASYPKAVGTK